MRIHSSLLAYLLAVTTAFAEKPKIEIDARYEGFEPSTLLEVQPRRKEAPHDVVLATPRVVTYAGKTATIQVIREIAVTPGKVANCGVTLEVTPELKDGQMTLSGMSTVRHQIQPGGKQPLRAMSFVARETYFSGAIPEGKALTIRVGAGPKDNSRITLRAKVIEPGDSPAR